jgi:hypothetical protein
MTEATPQDYWIAENALFIERNANADPDYIQASCMSGAQILVYIKGVIGYDAGHNYQRWTLQASPTVFGSHTEKYVYVAIPRPELTSKRTAIVVFPSERIDVYGKNEAEEQIGSVGYYYIFLQGILTSSGDNGSINREWKQHIVTGYLSSDEAINAGPTESQWFKYSSVDDYVTFLKNLTMKAGTVFAQLFARALTIVSGGSISFEGKEGSITGVATDETPLSSSTDIVTPEYLDDHALSKQHDDRTDHDLAMKNLTVNGTADVFGNTILRGDLTVGTAEHPQKAHVLGDLEVGVFNKGVQGAKVDFYGNAEFESIVGRSFLEVPELRYNRTTITVGNKWQTEGAGIIEKVWTIQDIPSIFNNSTEGIARLKLEEGEVGAIALNDKCQGVFHIQGVKNDPTTTDTRDGNFHFAGFKTIYFVVKEIYNAITLPAEVRALMEEGEKIGEQQYFRYELRAASCASLPAENRNHWTDATHPQPTMHFAAYANATNSDRQASRLTTTTYQLHLAGMTDWTYTEQNMRLIIGWLTGFSFLQRVWDKDKGEFVQVTKELNGEGIATGNIYMWGSIDQFDRVPQLVAQQLYFRATQTSQAPEGIVVNADTHLSYDLNGWQRDPITPSATDRFVWQQWLYTYSDGTYQVSDVAFHAADPTTLSVVLSQNIVSVAISDWYDPSAPDDISFTLTARMLVGESPMPITQATATYGKTERSGTSDNAVEMDYTATIAPDGMSVDYNVTLNGFVGVAVNGATPEDAFITFALTSNFGTATAVATIAQNHEGESGQDGTDGVSAVDISVNPRSVSLKKATIDQPFTIDVFVAQAGKYLAPMTDYVVSRPTNPSNVVLDQFGSGTDGHFFIQFHVPANNVANGNITFSVTDKNTKTAYPITVPVAMVQDGEHGKDGEPGKDGTDALTIHLSATSVTLHRSSMAQSFEVVITVYRGDQRLAYLNDYSCAGVEEAVNLISGLDVKLTELNNRSLKFTFNLAANALVNALIPFNVVETSTGISYPCTLSIATAKDGEPGGRGERGYTGVTVRRSEWQEGVDYRNDSSEDPLSVAPDGNRYLDEVSITDLASGSATYFLARPSHNGLTSSAANKPTADGNDYWQPINDLRPLRTSFADIMTAFINYLQVAQIQIVDDNNVPYGAFGGGEDVDYPLWFGGKTPNEAVVKFGKNGDAWIGKNFSVVNEDVNVTGNLHVNSLFLKQGDLIMKGGKKYLNLDNRTGNYFVLPDSENVYLPEPENYEGMQITVFLGQSLGQYSALSSERGIYFPYYVMAEHTGVFVTNSSAAKCIKSFDGLTSVTLVAAKAYSVLDTLYWVVTAQKGIIGLSDGTTPEIAYANEVTMALLPDGRLINYEP